MVESKVRELAATCTGLFVHVPGAVGDVRYSVHGVTVFVSLIASVRGEPQFAESGFEVSGTTVHSVKVFVVRLIFGSFTFRSSSAQILIFNQ